MNVKPEKENAFRRSPCPIANTLDVMGDKWSLLVIRDLRRGERTYGELQHSPEGIPTNILADRLKRLEEAGIIVRSAYQERPVRYAYALSEKGQALRGVLQAMVEWGKQHLPGTYTLDELASGAVESSEPAPRSTRARRKPNAG
ncbi:winged helix-turn-helix transcriptional regulator [Ralstonia sp. A12]|uniref:winged helix-turn-helix transcriptional regulator n=1 Tax=Ralstonia sp. A12 TaxID=1217052 RepID=UPI00069350DE